MKIKLSNRLYAVASMVRQGVTAADIGTDHAYIPIWLVQNGICGRVIASDCREGPVKRAVANVAACGLTGRIEVRMADGLNGMEVERPEDIVIAGMGGELIRDIIDAAPFVRDPAVRLLMQPMTRSAVLRRYLLENGFGIVRETLAEDDRIYEILQAVYGVSVKPYTEAELYTGRYTAADEPLLAAHLRRKCAILETKLAGRRGAGVDASADEKLFIEIKEIQTCIL